MSKTIEAILYSIPITFLLGLITVLIVHVGKRLQRAQVKSLIFRDYFVVLVLFLGFFQMAFGLQYIFHSFTDISVLFKVNIFILPLMLAVIMTIIIGPINKLSESFFMFQESIKTRRFNNLKTNIIHLFIVSIGIGLIVLLSNIFYQNTLVINSYN